MNKTALKEISKMILSAILLIISFVIKKEVISNILLLIAYVILTLDILKTMINNFQEKTYIDENTLMLIATIGAIIIHNYEEAVAVMLFYSIGEYIGDISSQKSEKGITDLLNIKSKTANLKTTNGLKEVAPETIKIGDIITIKQGEIIPLDGIIIEGNTLIDTSSLTGESVLKEYNINDEVLSGTINKENIINVKVTKEYKDSTVSKIIDMLTNIDANKSSSEKFITKFAKIYTPIVVSLAIILFVFPVLILKQPHQIWLYRSLSFLVASCPCALVISIPLAYFNAVGLASKKKILFKSSAALEKLSDIKICLFDKTGTLTKGNFEISKIIPLYKTKEEIIKYAAYAEYYSNHPISKIIKQEYPEVIDIENIKNYKEIPGKGITVTVDDEEVTIGNRELFTEENIVYPKVEFIGTVVLVAVNKTYIGTIVISDEIKETSVQTIEKLKELGIEKTVILSGDNSEIVKKVGSLLKIDESYANLLPLDKTELVKTFSKKEKVIFMGDGINDAPVLKLADIGVSMGNLGSDAAIEASDIVIMNDNPYLLTEAIEISRRTRKIVKTNIIFSIIVKILVLILCFFEIFGMWAATFADVGVTIIVIINSLRIWYEKK